MTDDWRAPIVATAREVFAFLEERGAKVVVEDEGWFTTLVYLLVNGSFEIELDWREQATFVLVCRGTRFERTSGYYLSEGRRDRRHLEEALSLAGLVNPPLHAELRASLRGSGPDAMHGQLRLYGSALEPTVDQLIDRYDQLFT